MNLYHIDQKWSSGWTHTRVLLTKKEYELERVDLSLNESPLKIKRGRFQAITKHNLYLQIGIEVNSSDASWLLKNCSMVANEHSKVNDKYNPHGCRLFNKLLRIQCPYNFSLEHTSSILINKGYCKKHKVMKEENKTNAICIEISTVSTDSQRVNGNNDNIKQACDGSLSICSKAQNSCGKSLNYFDKSQNTCGKSQNNCSKLEKNCRKSENNFGKLQDYCGKSENNCGQLKNNCGKAQSSDDAPRDRVFAQKNSNDALNKSDETPRNSDNTPQNSDDTLRNSDDTPRNSDDTAQNSVDTLRNSDDTAQNSDDTPRSSEETDNPLQNNDTMQTLRRSSGKISNHLSGQVWAELLDQLCS